jgi:Tfp pilus assembly protein PilN
MRDRFKPLADAMVAAVLAQAEKDARPIEQVLQELAATVPPEEWAGVPTDLSERHDGEKEKTPDDH